MTSQVDVLDAVVVGAGWAGLGISHALTASGQRHLVLERGRIAETWLTQRWDSFRMNVPNGLSVLPGDTYSGPDPEGVMTRDEFVAMLTDYAARHRLPIEEQCAALQLTQDKGDSAFTLQTQKGTLHTRNVMVASGSQNCPKRPAWAAGLPDRFHQLDASSYRNAAELPEGAVLVVGSAQSGGQVAEDLAEAGRQVYLATSHTGRVARRYRGRDTMFWLIEAGFFEEPRSAFMQASGQIAVRPLLGALHTISLQSLSALGVVLLGRFTGLEAGGRLCFANDLEQHLVAGDEASAAAKRRVDNYFAGAGIAAPPAEPDPAEVVAVRRAQPPILSLDPVECGITTLLWCTGFRGDYGWVGVPGALDPQGQPVHEDGVAPVPGIYFAGMDFATTRRSGTILAIAEEAPRLVRHMLHRKEQERVAAT